MADVQNNITTVFSADISNFTASAQQLNRYVSTVTAEFKAATAGMDDWSKEADGLQAKLTQLNGVLDAQKKRLADTEAEYNALVAAGKGNTAEAQKLYIQLRNQQAQVAKTEKEIEKYTDALENLDNQTEETEKSSSKFGETLGGAVKGAIVGIGAAVAGAVTAFLGLAEATRETRTQMGQLQAAYENVGLTAEQAAATHTTLTGILGDSGQATEAAQLIAQLASNEQELADLTNVATGVYATFGEALPVQSLMETINHSAELGSVQGSLADALEWSGVSVDDFNAQLAACNDEQERQELITSTLNGLYGEAAEKYREVNADVIAANEAQQTLTNTMAELGAIAEPIMTTLKLLAADLLTTILPFVQLLGEGFTAALNGSAEGAGLLAEGLTGILSTLTETVTNMLPTVIDVFVQLVPQLVNALVSQLPAITQAAVDIVVSLASGLGDMLPTLIPTVINAVLLIAQTLIDNVDQIIDAGVKLILGLANGLINALPQLIAKIPQIINSLINAIVNNLPKLIQMGIQLTVALANGLMQAIPQLVGQLPQIVASIVSGLVKLIPQLVQCGKDMLAGLFQSFSPKNILKMVGDIGKNIVNGFKKVLKINSPSKVFEELGEYSGDGYLGGFAGTLKSAQRTLNAGRFAGDVVQATGGAVTNNNNNSRTVNVYQTFEKMPTTQYALRMARLETVNALKYGG